MSAALPKVPKASPRQGGRIAGFGLQPTLAVEPSQSRRGSAQSTLSGIAAKKERRRQNRSAFESNLQSPTEPHFPSIKIGPLAEALRRDEERQNYKYTFQSPAAMSARYHAGLPEAGQTEKYCREEVRKPQPDSPPTRFNTATLSRWFQAIDRDNSGTVSQKELILALRNSRELRNLFCQLQGLAFGPQAATAATPYGGGSGTTHNSVEPMSRAGVANQLDRARSRSGCGTYSVSVTPEPQQLPDEYVQEALRKAKERKLELKRLKDILRDLDEDSSGTMDFEEFVEFFRRAGLLLEYHTGQTFPATCPAEYFANAASQVGPQFDGAEEGLNDREDELQRFQPDAVPEGGRGSLLSPCSHNSSNKMTPKATKGEVWMQAGGRFVSREAAVNQMSRGSIH